MAIDDQVGAFQSLPVPDPDTAPFWEACARHELAFQHCAGCGAARFPPAPICSRCRSWEFDWQPHPGTGRVYTWVVVHHAIPPSIEPAVPYASAIVELDGGLKMPGRLIQVEKDAIEAGMAVEVDFHDLETASIPVFKPAKVAPR